MPSNGPGPLSELLQSAAPPASGTLRRTKIVATVGPSSNSEAILRELIRAGADAFRVNFSHGTAEERATLISLIRRAAADGNRHIPIIGDIQGPKIRLGDVEGVATLVRGSEFILTTIAGPGSAERVSTPFTPLPREVEPGDRIMINDGLVEIRVKRIEGENVVTEVVRGGPISSRKGMNFPDSELSIPSVTEKDREDLAFAAAHDLDYVAASFVRKKEDVEAIRQILSDAGGTSIGVIAKLEKRQAIEKLDSILEVSDSVMVARGDLGVELPPESVPIIQKRVLEWASHRGRLAITATQMLESMTASSRPTRAEASDVANAIFDGSDAVMLSAETAAGAFPVEAVEMMSRIILAAEANPELRVHRGRDPIYPSHETDEVADAIAGAASHAANEIDARYIVVLTRSGFSARLISQFRPRSPIVAVTPSVEVARKMNLLWGVSPIVESDIGEYHEQIVERLEAVLLDRGLVSRGDRVVMMMGSPSSKRARTNLLRVHQIGQALRQT